MEHFTPKKLEFKISQAKRIAGVYCCAYNCKQKPVYKKNTSAINTTLSTDEY